jgi:ribosomal protein S19
VTAAQVGAIATINGVTAPGGHILISQQGEDLETVNDPESGTILLVNNHNGRKDNPHEVTHDQVGPMPVEYGPDETRNKHISNSDYTRWEDHLANESNPHAVTAVQVGAVAAINGVTALGGHILIWQQGEDLETVNNPEAGTILLINNHNGRIDNPHEVTHDQVGPMPVEYGPDETRDKHLSNSDYTALVDHLHSPVAHGSTPENMGGRIVRRDAEGRAKVSDPEDDDDIATKRYVDQEVRDILDNLFVEEGELLDE